MNHINPRKLLNSKWTAVSVINREKHFLVTHVEWDEEERHITRCVIEAVLTHRQSEIEWQTLKDNNLWKTGWQ